MMQSRRGRWLTCVFLLAAMGACRTAPSPQPSDVVGTWVLPLESRVFLVLTVSQAKGSYSGTLSDPQHWSTSTGTTFSEVSPKVSTRSFTRVDEVAGGLKIVIANPADKSDEDEFELTIIDADHATLAFVDAPFKPLPLTRSRLSPSPVVATDWDSKGSYALGAVRETANSDMAAIYEQDQKARQEIDPAAVSDEKWTAIEAADAERRKQTRTLLDAGALKAGEDFRKAAMLFQHGDHPDDYLLAHTLAMIALAKGDAEARWIAAATLDRYLHSIGKPEIYGAGFSFKNGKPEQETPFNKALVSDPLRGDLGVPPLAEQQKQFEEAMKALDVAGC